MEKIKIDLGARSYDILVGSDLLSQNEIFSGHIAGRNVAIITNSTVGPLYLSKLRSSLKLAKLIITVTLDDGEQFKTQASLDLIYKSLLENKFGRDSILIALGGGVVGDIAGYAAATYMRGIDFIQVPTTLLAQVDSSVGGKTGINHPQGKNMIGAFYQPRGVIIDISCLKTLPDNELSAGLAEVIKYGLINDFDFFLWLEMEMDNLVSKEPRSLITAIIRSCQNKAKVVAEDELETEKGIRATLNLGHTFAHAIEAGVGYGNWLHGEAVAAGMVMAAYMSLKQGWITDDDFKRIKNLISRARLPLNPPDLSVDVFMELMVKDKKNKDGEINLVLLKKLGQAFLTKDYCKNFLDDTLRTKSF